MEYNNDPKLVEQLAQIRVDVSRLLIENQKLKEKNIYLRAIIVKFIDSHDA